MRDLILQAHVLDNNAPTEDKVAELRAAGTDAEDVAEAGDAKWRQGRHAAAVRKWRLALALLAASPRGDTRQVLRLMKTRASVWPKVRTNLGICGGALAAQPRSAHCQPY